MKGPLSLYHLRSLNLLSLFLIVKSQWEQLINYPLREFRNIIDDKRINSILIGPGLCENNNSILKIKSILKTNKSIVLDAGAISCFRGKLHILKNIISDKEVVITPHEGELKAIMPHIEGNCIDKALKASSELNCIVVFS